MILPYLLRLLCLCFASFFVLNAALGLLVRISSKSAIRFAESRAPRAAARFLLALRMLPFAFAALFVLALCVPSYLRFEPALTSERAGAVCLVLGLLGAATCSLAIARSARSLLVSWRHNRLCQLAAQKAPMPRISSQMLVVENEVPLLAMSGLFGPKLLISTRVLRELSHEELDAALRHEQAHRSSRDNAKRLLLLLAPDILPFVRPLRLAGTAAGQNSRSGPPTIKPLRETPPAPFPSPLPSSVSPGWVLLLACPTSPLRFSPATAISPPASIACSAQLLQHPREPCKRRRCSPSLAYRSLSASARFFSLPQSSLSSTNCSNFSSTNWFCYSPRPSPPARPED